MNRQFLTRALPVFVAISAGCLFAGPAVAQPINFRLRPAEHSHELHFGVGFESAFVAAVGYSHGVRLFDQGIILFIAAEAGIDWAAATYIKHSERYREATLVRRMAGTRRPARTSTPVFSAATPFSRGTSCFGRDRCVTTSSGRLSFPSTWQQASTSACRLHLEAEAIG